MKYWIAVFFFFPLFIGCEKEENENVFTDNRPEPGPVNLRIENTSGANFSEVLIRAPSGKHFYGTLNAGDTSSYQNIEKLYRYAPAEIVIGNDTIYLSIFDYVGEELLPTANYTFLFDTVNSGPNVYLKQSLRKD